MVECDCAHKRRMERAVPPRFKSAQLIDFPTALRYKIVNWIENPGDGLFITGGAGRGKTHLAAAMVMHLMLVGWGENKNAVFLRCFDFYADLREKMRLGEATENAYVEPVRADWLALDDLGAGALTDFERYSITELLDRRVNRVVPTIVTSNWNLEEIARKMDERVASRLSAFKQIEIAGVDRRLA